MGDNAHANALVTLRRYVSMYAAYWWLEQQRPFLFFVSDKFSNLEIMECFGHKCLCDDSCSLYKDCIINHPLFTDNQQSVYNQVKYVHIPDRHKKIIDLLQEKQPPKVSRKQIEKFQYKKANKKKPTISSSLRGKTKKILADAEKCFYCELKFIGTAGANAGLKTRDHIIPLNKGGHNIVRNMVICCKWCNEQKGNLLLVDFYDKIDAMPPLSDKNRDKEIILDNIILLIKKIEPYYNSLLRPSKKKGVNVFNQKLSTSFPPPAEKKREQAVKTAHYVNYMGKDCPCVGFIEKAFSLTGTAGVKQYQNAYYHSGEQKYLFEVHGGILAYPKEKVEKFIRPFFPKENEKIESGFPIVKQHFKKDCKDISLSVNDNTRGGKIIPIDREYVLYLQSQTPEQLELAKKHGGKIAKILTEPQINFHE